MTDVVRLYAKVVGASVILVGLAGLVLGDKSLFGVLNIDIAEDGIHLLTGGLIFYAGFARDLRVTRAIVGGIGRPTLSRFTSGSTSVRKASVPHRLRTPTLVPVANRLRRRLPTVDALTRSLPVRRSRPRRARMVTCPAASL